MRLPTTIKDTRMKRKSRNFAPGLICDGRITERYQHDRAAVAKKRWPPQRARADLCAVHSKKAVAHEGASCEEPSEGGEPEERLKHKPKKIVRRKKKKAHGFGYGTNLEKASRSPGQLATPNYRRHRSTRSRPPRI